MSKGTSRKIKPLKIMKGIKFYCVEDLVKILEISPGSVRDYLRKGKIASVKVGIRFWVSERNLNDFLFCRGIRDLPDSELIEMIDKAVEVRYKAWTEEAIPLIQKTVMAFLLSRKIKGDFKKIKEENKDLEKVLPGKVVQKLRYRETETKKQFEKIK
jgi:hypothetical protein